MQNRTNALTNLLSYARLKGHSLGLESFCNYRVCVLSTSSQTGLVVVSHKHCLFLRKGWLSVAESYASMQSRWSFPVSACQSLPVLNRLPHSRLPYPRVATTLFCAGLTRPIKWGEAVLTFAQEWWWCKVDVVLIYLCVDICSAHLINDADVLLLGSVTSGCSHFEK